MAKRKLDESVSACPPVAEVVLCRQCLAKVAEACAFDAGGTA